MILADILLSKVLALAMTVAALPHLVLYPLTDVNLPIRMKISIQRDWY